MKLHQVAGVLACLGLAAQVASAVTLDAAYTTTAQSDMSCNPGPRSTNFLTTDATVWLYVAASNAGAGDVLTVDWLMPSGQVYYKTTFEGLPEAGNYCFDDYLDVAGQPAAQSPGTWTIRGHWNGGDFFTVTFTLSAAGGTTSGTATVQSTADIFLSGHSGTIGISSPGTAPPMVAVSGSAGKVFRFSGATGTWNCQGGGATSGPDGDNCYSSTNIASYRGISGIIHTSKTMFLVGVFLSDAEPADPAPARLDVSTANTATSIQPLLAQTFFIGDGLTSGGATQEFTIPAGATRLFLGIADAGGFQGGPCCYEDNSGSVKISWQIGASSGGGGGGGGGGNCSYYVNPLTNSIPAAGGTGLVLITTAPTCAWTAKSNVSWITITAGSSGTGGGAVSYTVAANTSSSSRTGTLTIADQTHTVTQAAAAACTYALNASGNSFAAAGGSAGVLVTASAGCFWTAASNNSWITITSAPSGTGGGTVSYTVAANTSTSQRTGTMTIAGLTFTVTQAGAAAANTPTITNGGIINAASYMPASMDAGALARGSFFTIFGTNLGPAQYQSQTTYPLNTTLGEVTVKITAGSTSVNAYMVYASANQINAILPSNAPTGNVQIVVTYHGVASPASPAKVVDTNFGIFSTSNGRGPGVIQNYVSPTVLPLNTRTATAKPGQVAVLLGTGLGPITAPDNLAPPTGDLPVPVQILVAGKVASKSYSGRMPGVAGVDQINFTVPADAPSGCYVPVQIKAGNVYSNIVTMAIQPEGQTCSDPQNPFSDLVSNGRKGGSIFLVRANAHAQLDASQPATDLSIDFGVAAFEDNTGHGDLGYNPLFSLPPVGTCSAYAGNLDLSSLLSGSPDLSGAAGLLGKDLDAGSAISITGPKGNTIAMNHMDTDKNTGPYLALLGGSIPLPGVQSLPPFLDPGTFKISGPGGKDVGPFQTTFSMGAPVTWTNRDQMAQIDRTQDLTFKWSGGDSSKLVMLAGLGADQNTQALAGFFCFVPSTPGSFTVPTSVLGNLPAGGTNALGAVLVGSFPSTYPTFTASGLDSGLIFNANLSLATVTFK
ncbi:MAG: hypothetical protein LAP38_09590 [Acidobacteriia bacterium]|nr:hypothetical protein [Terriglobia bacterium]